MPDVHAWLEALAAFYGHYGYALVFFGTLGENTAVVGLFLPGSALALLGGFYARQGELSLAWVIVLTWWAMVLGYHFDYLIGRFILAHAVARWGTTALGRRLRLAGRLRLSRRLLDRYGGKAILISHTVGHIRSFVALSAGAGHMSYRRFLAFELVAALLWSTAFCLVGYLIGSQREHLQILIGRSGWAALALVLVTFLVWRLISGRNRRLALRPRRRCSPTPSSKMETRKAPTTGRAARPLRESTGEY